jgi:Ca2+-binding EF-hand superfamily protein
MPPSKQVQLKLRKRELRPHMRPKVSAKLHQTLRAHFDRMDMKGTGTLDAADLWRGLLELGIRISQAEVLDLIHTVDVNLTGTLEYAEFEDLWAMHMVSTSAEVRATCTRH